MVLNNFSVYIGAHGQVYQPLVSKTSFTACTAVEFIKSFNDPSPTGLEKEDSIILRVSDRVIYGSLVSAHLYGIIVLKIHDLVVILGISWIPSHI